ncbi:hypothetical protein D3C86_1559990 [compost metagenome]
MLALSMAAIPITIKFNGITPASKNRLDIKANSNPSNAPIKMLGAKTPPSPPEDKVTEVITGFNSIHAANVRSTETAGIAVLDVIIFSFTA